MAAPMYMKPSRALATRERLASRYLGTDGRWGRAPPEHAPQMVECALRRALARFVSYKLRTNNNHQNTHLPMMCAPHICAPQ